MAPILCHRLILPWLVIYRYAFQKDKQLIQVLAVLLCVQVLAMGELIKSGKIKAWGVSNETTFGEQDETLILFGVFGGGFAVRRSSCCR